MNFDEQGKKSLTEVLAVLKSALLRYWRISWAPALVIFALIIMLTVRLPDYFISEVVIFIQPQKVSSNLVKGPGAKEQEERFEAMIQELLARPRILSVIQRFNLYPQFEGVIGREHALNTFRGSISINPIKAASGKALTQTFRVSYRHNDPQLAFKVTKALANLFIEESIVNQRSETQGTEEFLDGQLRAARKRLEITEGQVQQFVRKHVGKLPEHREQALARLANAQQQLSTNSQMIASHMSRLQYAQNELRLTRKETVPDGVGATGAAALATDPRASLDQLQKALVILRSKYSDKHPDVINTKKRIEMLQAKLKSEGKLTNPKSTAPAYGGGSSREVRELRRQINTVQIEIQSLQKENAALKETIKELNEDVKAMPIKQQELTKITRDYQQVKDNYERLLAAKEEAAIHSSLVRSQKGSSFKIVDPPSLPVTPAGPQRGLVVAIGIASGIVVFFGIPLGLFFLNGSFKFRDDAEEELEVSVLAAIPPMDTPAAQSLRRRASATSFVASVFSFFGGAVIIFLMF